MDLNDYRLEALAEKMKLKYGMLYSKKEYPVSGK